VVTTGNTSFNIQTSTYCPRTVCVHFMELEAQRRLFRHTTLVFMKQCVHFAVRNKTLNFNS